MAAKKVPAWKQRMNKAKHERSSREWKSAAQVLIAKHVVESIQSNMFIHVHGHGPVVPVASANQAGGGPARNMLPALLSSGGPNPPMFSGWAHPDDDSPTLFNAMALSSGDADGRPHTADPATAVRISKRPDLLARFRKAAKGQVMIEQLKSSVACTPQPLPAALAHAS